MENNKFDVNLTHKTEIEVVSPVKLFLSRLLNIVEYGLSTAFFFGGLGFAITHIGSKDIYEAPGGFAVAIFVPIGLHLVRKTVDYLFNLEE